MNDERPVTKSGRWLRIGLIGVGAVGVSCAIAWSVIDSTRSGTTTTTGPSTTPAPNSVQLDGACSGDKDCANGLACRTETHTCRPSL